MLVTRTGRRQTEENVARRLKTVIRRANKRLAELGIEPISEKVTPHSLRRTWASLRAACGDDQAYIAEQGGWTDPTFVFRVYQKAAKRRAKLSGVYLAEFDRARMGRSGNPRKGSKRQRGHYFTYRSRPEGIGGGSRNRLTEP